MIQYNKILVAFDGSENGLKALAAAKKLTQDNDSHLTVLYVHDSPLEYPINISTTLAGDNFLYMDPGPLVDNAPIVPVTEERVIVDEMPNEVITIAKAKLSDIEKVSFETLVGNPAEEIIEYAISDDTDLIVIGHRGIGGFQKLFMGSVSDSVSNHSECSIFIVK